MRTNSNTTTEPGFARKGNLSGYAEATGLRNSGQLEPAHGFAAAEDLLASLRGVDELADYVLPEVWLENSATGRAGMTTGIAYSNMNIDSGGLQIFDAEGYEVFERRLFTNSARWHDDQGREDLNMRKAHDDFDLGQFAVPLSKFMMAPGETYSYKVTIYSSTGETFVVAEDTFTNGTAK